MPRFQLSAACVSVGAIALTLLLKLLIERFVAVEHLFLLFIPAIAISAWYGSQTTGLLSTVLVGAIAYYNLVDPDFSLIASNLGFTSASPPSMQWLLAPESELELLLLLLEGGLLSSLLGQLPSPLRLSPAGEAYSSFVPDQAPRRVVQSGTGLLAERVTANSAAPIANSRLSNLLEGIDAAFYTLDRQGHLTYLNRQAACLLQKPSEELLGKKLWELHPEAIGSRLQQACQAATTGGAIEFEVHCNSRNLWLAVKVYALVEEFAVCCQDITKRKQIEAECDRYAREAERLLRREQAMRAVAEASEQRSVFLSEASKVLSSTLDYEATLANIAQLIVPFLADYCLIFCQQDSKQLQPIAVVHHDPRQQPLVEDLAQFYRSNRTDPQNWVTQVLKTGNPLLISPDDMASAEDHVQDAKLADLYEKLGLQHCIVVPLIAREQAVGAIQFVISNSQRHYTPGDFALAIELGQRAAVAIDNAQLYRQAQALNRLKDEFLATLSHELRTPLHAVLGWAQLLQTRRFDDITNRAIETIGRNARVQAKLIDSLLDASRIITGRVRLRPRWSDFAAIVNGAIATQLVAAEAKSIQLSFTLDAPVGSLWIDPRYIRQVVWHLISNAIKFTPVGGQVQISLSVVKEAGSEDQESSLYPSVPTYAQLVVSDTGQGISPEFLPYVFDRFRQEDGSMTRNYGGLGLGLAIVRYLVELHGGTIEADSAGVGQGATFTLRLPMSISLPPSDTELEN